jgi:hypothetical protein
MTEPLDRLLAALPKDRLRDYRDIEWTLWAPLRRFAGAAAALYCSALDRAEKAEARLAAADRMAEAIAKVEAHAPFDPNVQDGIPAGFWRDVNALNDSWYAYRRLSGGPKEE